MIVPDVAFSLIVAAVFSTLFAVFIRRGTPRKGFFWFFLVIFLAAWAGGVWGNAFTLPFGGRSWFPFFTSGLLAAILLSLLAPKPPNVDRESVLSRKETLDLLDEIEERKELVELAYISVNAFFWMFVILLLVLIVTRYLLS